MNGTTVAIIAFAVLFVLTMIILYKRKVELETHGHESKKIIQNKCSSAVLPGDTIFVLLLLADATAAAIQDVRLLYLKAACPYRVFVGIVAAAAATAAQQPSLSSMLYEMARSEIQRSGRDFSFLQKNVRFLLQPGSVAAAAAKTQTFSRLYRNEMYVLDMTSKRRPMLTNVVQDWDVICIEQLQRCTLISRKPVVSCDIVGPASVIQFPLFQYDAVSQLAVLSSQPIAAKVIPKPIPISFVTSTFIFTFAVAYKDVADGGGGGLDTNDLVLSARLWQYGWDFFVPVVCPFLATSGAAAAAAAVGGEFVDASAAAAAAATEMQQQQHDNEEKRRRRTLADYGTLIGVDFTTSTVYQKAFLGIVSETDLSEILIKYGSHENYISAAQLTENAAASWAPQPPPREQQRRKHRQQQQQKQRY